MRFALLAVSLVVFSSTCVFSQNAHIPLTEKNEKTIFSFVNQSGRTVTVSSAQDGSYIVYRYGRGKNVDFEFPKNRKDSWKTFTYSGTSAAEAQLEGKKADYLSFDNGDFTYVLYQECAGAGKETLYGLKVQFHSTKRTTDFRGNPDTMTGSLSELRDNDKINKKAD